jgi:hypothetical protein
LNVSSLAKGVYIVTGTVNGEKVSQKLSKTNYSFLLKNQKGFQILEVFFVLMCFVGSS